MDPTWNLYFKFHQWWIEETELWIGEVEHAMGEVIAWWQRVLE
jgi:hypothetical protein